MASLIIAASFMTYNKIRDKRAAKKETKRKGYETRYNELERERTVDQEKHIQTQPSGESRTEGSNVRMAQHSPAHEMASEQTPRHTSNGSRRSSTESQDDPSAWVDHVIKERSKQGSGGHA